MKVWTCVEFQGRYPVPTTAVVIAPTAKAAADALNTHLKNIGLFGDVVEKDMVRVFTNHPHVVILSDGDY